MTVTLMGWASAWPGSWRTRRAEPGSPAFSLGLALTCFYGLLLIPSWVFYNQLLLYPAILLILQQRAVLASGRGAGAGGLWGHAGLASLVLDHGEWVGVGLAGGDAAGSPSLVASITGIWQLPWISGLVLPRCCCCRWGSWPGALWPGPAPRQ